MTAAHALKCRCFTKAPSANISVRLLVFRGLSSQNKRFLGGLQLDCTTSSPTVSSRIYCYQCWHRGRLYTALGKMKHPRSLRYFLDVYEEWWVSFGIIVQELCESRGGRPGLSVLTSFLVSVDVKIYCTVLRHWSQLVPNMSHDI